MRDITTCLTMMQGTAHRLSGALSEPEVIQVLLEQAMLVFEARGALVRLLSPNGQELVLGGASGLSDAYLNKGPVWLSNSGVDRHVIAGEAIVIDDISHEAGFQYPAAAAAEGLQGAIAVPLRVRHRPAPDLLAGRGPTWRRGVAPGELSCRFGRSGPGKGSPPSGPLPHR